MRTLSLLFLLLIPFSITTAFASGPELTSSNAHVVLHLPSLSDASLAALHEKVGTRSELGMEYSCVWAGIVVLHLEGVQLTERADVITYVRRVLNEARLDADAEFLHVHLEPAGPGKC